MGMETFISIAGALIAADFSLALRRPSLHERLDDAYAALIGFAMFIIAGVLIGTWVIDDMALPRIPQIEPITQTVRVKSLSLLGGLFVLMVLHMLARLVASISAQDKVRSKDGQ